MNSLPLFYLGKDKTEMKKLSPGQTLVEYALILSLIVIMAIAGMVIMRDQISAFFANLANVLAGYSS